MERIYLLTGPLWEMKDMTVCTDQKQAIQLSANHPMLRVEVFMRMKNSSEETYYPTYCYYQGGAYFERRPT
jgi:hypothetical protein